MVSDYVKMVTELNVSSLNTLHKLENHFTRLCLVAVAFLAFGMRFFRRAFRTVKLNRLLVNVLDNSVTIFICREIKVVILCNTNKCKNKFIFLTVAMLPACCRCNIIGLRIPSNT